MPRRIYRADLTHREIQRMFAGALASFGGIGDGSELSSMHALKVNGEILGDSRPRLHKPYSNHYSKEENESIAVARMLLQLNLDRKVTNIVERERPDRQVVFDDESSVFVETRVVESGQIREERFLEDANHLLLTSAQHDDALASRLHALNITIALNAFAVKISMRQLIKETIAFIKGILTPEGSNEKISALYPALFLSSARAFWKRRTYEQRTILQKHRAWVDADYISGELDDAVEDKRRRALTYETSCTPLWLLLSVVDIRPLPSTVGRSIRSLFARIDNIEPFDRLVVIASGIEAMVLKAN